MPCVRKKGESDRPEFTVGGVRDVDEVVTTRWGSVNNACHVILDL
jgi:iron only hydrogenase large subunit-like protein